MSQTAQPQNNIVIAIDGTFSSGKGTLGKRLAAHYDYAYLDTGKLYRAIAHMALLSKIDLANEDAVARLAKDITPDILTDPILKSGDVGAAASKVAVHPKVRAALLDFQRDFAANPPNGRKGAILDGRDIGTVICPDADVKLYVDAEPEVRAQRRYQELLGYGEETTFETVLAQLTERDARDKGRAQAPLKAADDAHRLDTTHLDIAGVVRAATTLIDARLSGKALQPAHQISKGLKFSGRLAMIIGALIILLALAGSIFLAMIPLLNGHGGTEFLSGLIVPLGLGVLAICPGILIYFTGRHIVKASLKTPQKLSSGISIIAFILALPFFGYSYMAYAYAIRYLAIVLGLIALFLLLWALALFRASHALKTS